MKIVNVQIKGIKSHNDSSFSPEKYTALVGENNCGKSNILSALRWFFGEIKLRPTDLTHNSGNDPSVIINFKLEESDEGIINIDKELLSNNHIIIEAYYLKGDVTKDVSPKYRIKSSEDKEIKKLPFNTEIVYVPSVRELNDELKFTANSAINKLIGKFVVERIKTEDEKSNKYKNVYNSIQELSLYISTGEHSAFEELKNIIQKKMLDYSNVDIKFKLEPFNVDELIKSSFRHYIKTEAGELPTDSQGMGFQRSLIFSLICSVSELKTTTDLFTLYLVEEPELFLHPNHQTSFRNMLIKLSEKHNNQVVLTSHTPYFLNNISNYSEIKRVAIENNHSKIYELDQAGVKSICTENGKLMAEAKSEAQANKWDDAKKKEEAEKIAQEDELRYLLWVDPERANAFLSNKVILVEGKTEKAFFSFMINNPQGEFSNETKIADISIVDVNGKYHFYKFANLLHKLGINSWIMYDGDGDRNSNGISHKKLNEYIEKMKTDGIIIDCLRLDPELESCLGFEKDGYNADIALYHNLSTRYFECKKRLEYEQIKAFINRILEKN